MKDSAQNETFDLATDLDFGEGVDLSFGEDAKESPPLPDSFEDAVKEETSEFLQAFRKRAKDEELRKNQNISTDYWFAVYFANQEQRDAFLRKVKLIEMMDDQYIDGQTFADALNIKIPHGEITTPKAFRSPAGIEDLIMDI